MRSRNFAIAAAFGIGGLAGVLIASGWHARSDDAVTPTLHPIWAEAQWPFPIDQWGQGKAFECKAADCGTSVNIYLRAKIGFCNCLTGVDDDEELERLGEFDLIVANNVVARESGKPIAVGWMKGRSRAYSISGWYRPRQSAIAVAFNDRCDAIVATVVLGHDRPAEIEPHVIEFLNSNTVLLWAEVSLGL